MERRSLFMDWKTMLLQRPYHPKWSTELIQALPKFQGHFLQKETKWWFERRNSGCRVYDDLFVERWQKCAGFRALPINTALSCSPDLLDRTLHNFPVWQESTYIKQTKWRNACREHQRGKRWLPDDWSLPGAGSCELGRGTWAPLPSPCGVHVCSGAQEHCSPQTIQWLQKPQLLPGLQPQTQRRPASRWEFWQGSSCLSKEAIQEEFGSRKHRCIRLSEVSQTEDKYWMISLICET